MINLILPWPPTVNSIYIKCGKRNVLQPKVKEYRKHVMALCAGKKKLSGNLEAQIYLYPPDKRRRDIDNILKSLFDALEKANIFDNDNQIKKMSVEMLEEKRGEVSIFIGTKK